MRKPLIYRMLLLGLSLLLLPAWGGAQMGVQDETAILADEEEQSERQDSEESFEEGEEIIGEADRVWTIAVISDLNGSYGSTTYNRHVHRATEWISETLRPDIVVSAGDMVAGQRRGLDYAAMWAAFHAAVTDVLAAAGLPLAVTPGNHDASGSPAFWEERIHFAREWKIRRPQLSFVDDSFYPFYYAFELGPALFISLDGTQVGPLDQAQRDWVRGVLERNSHKEVKFVMSHLPLYPVAQGRETEILNDRELESIFEEFGVDMMIGGHHHAYFPGRRGDTFHLFTACLGSGQRALIGEEQVSPRNVAVVQFDASGVINVEAYGGNDFDEIVDHQLLPRTIGSGEQQVWRMDVEPDQEVYGPYSESGLFFY